MVFAALVAVGLIARPGVRRPGGRAAADRAADRGRGARSPPQAFADAYGAEDPAALRATLARDVSACCPAGAARGATRSSTSTQRQFDGKVGGYDLDDLTVTGGRAGRASGTYKVDRDGGDPYEGTIVFGVIRERGEPRIQLIAATPKT